MSKQRNDERQDEIDSAVAKYNAGAISKYELSRLLKAALAQTKVITIRLTSAQYNAIRERAQRDGRSMNNWILTQLERD